MRLPYSSLLNSNFSNEHFRCLQHYIIKQMSGQDIQKSLSATISKLLIQKRVNRNLKFRGLFSLAVLFQVTKAQGRHCNLFANFFQA